MANIALVNNWSPTVYQWADGDVLDGGPDSLEVLPVKQLANNSLHQRLVNVTVWDAGLAATYGYPAKACVMHGGVSWRAVADNNVPPATDPTKWERWGYSDSELDAKLAGLLPYGAPTACANTGPDGAANKATLHKSALGEYWMWLGDVWGVINGHYLNAQEVAWGKVPGASNRLLELPFTCPRAGRVSAKAGFTGNPGSVPPANYSTVLRINKNGVELVGGQYDNAYGGAQSFRHSATNDIVVSIGDIISINITNWLAAPITNAYAALSVRYF